MTLDEIWKAVAERCFTALKKSPPDVNIICAWTFSAGLRELAKHQPDVTLAEAVKQMDDIADQRLAVRAEQLTLRLEEKGFIVKGPKHAQ